MIKERILPTLAWLNADSTCKQIDRNANAHWDNLIVACEKAKALQG
jgi:hypothetical protein